MNIITWRTIIWQQFGADQRCEFPWSEEVSFAELQRYGRRHVQEHASQLGLLLGQKGVAAPDWVAIAEHKTA